MRGPLAERLLANVMGWTPEDVARERPVLQMLGNVKYDEYKQFAPGMRFTESLALWLRQFASLDERRIAYDFVRCRLVFLSDAEMAHIVNIAYPDHIKPLLLERTAEQIGVPTHMVGRIESSDEFSELQRRTLFLGLSDGARIDSFRRANPELSHEQIWQTFEITPEKAKTMAQHLQEDLSQVSGRSLDTCPSRFSSVFLLDDFSGSGISYIRKEAESGFGGKIARFYMQLRLNGSGLSVLVDTEHLCVGIVLYVATEQAMEHLQRLLAEMSPELGVNWHTVGVQPLSSDTMVTEDGDPQFIKLMTQYYDSSVEDEHTRKGGETVRLGFGGCALPIVLTHNTPNNSVFLLWADPIRTKIRGLFPRVSRHRSER